MDIKDGPVPEKENPDTGNGPDGTLKKTPVYNVGGSMSWNGSSAGGGDSTTWAAGTSITTSTTSGDFRTVSPGILMIPSAVESKPKKLVVLPRKITKRVVIGFIEDGDEDEITWSAKVKLIDFALDFHGGNGEGQMVFTVGLEDLEAAEAEEKK